MLNKKKLKKDLKKFLEKTLITKEISQKNFYLKDYCNKKTKELIERWIEGEEDWAKFEDSYYEFQLAIINILIKEIFKKAEITYTGDGAEVKLDNVKIKIFYNNQEEDEITITVFGGER